MAVGGTIGGYELLRHLARGGMADVFLARRTRGTSEPVVLKMLRPELAGDPARRSQFLDEARLVSSLDHANLGRACEFGTAGGECFIAMEHLRGADLGRIAATAGGLSWPAAVHVATSIASALHHAHERRFRHGHPAGVVHRDVSPHNVFLTDDGGVKLLDFGIAGPTGSPATTADGRVLGTLGYMSPEQAGSRPVDRRSDLFSLGVVLWELVTRRRLFPGSDPLAVARRILEEDAPAPSRLADACPPALERVILRALARDPDRRYATAEEMRLDLDSVARELAPGWSPEELGRVVAAACPDRDQTATLRRRARRHGLAAGLVPGLVLGAALALGIVLWRHTGGAAAATPPVRMLPVTQAPAGTPAAP